MILEPNGNLIHFVIDLKKNEVSRLLTCLLRRLEADRTRKRRRKHLSSLLWSAVRCCLWMWLVVKWVLLLLHHQDDQVDDALPTSSSPLTSSLLLSRDSVEREYLWTHFFPSQRSHWKSVLSQIQLSLHCHLRNSLISIHSCWCWETNNLTCHCYL